MEPDRKPRKKDNDSKIDPNIAANNIHSFQKLLEENEARYRCSEVSDSTRPTLKPGELFFMFLTHTFSDHTNKTRAVFRSSAGPRVEVLQRAGFGYGLVWCVLVRSDRIR